MPESERSKFEGVQKMQIFVPTWGEKSGHERLRRHFNGDAVRGENCPGGGWSVGARAWTRARRRLRCGGAMRTRRSATVEWSEKRPALGAPVVSPPPPLSLSLCAVRQFGEATSHQFPLNYKSIAGTVFSLSLSRPPLCIINHSLFQCPNPLPSVPPSCSRTGDFSLSLALSVWGCAGATPSI